LLLVQVFQDQYNFGGVETGGIFVEITGFAQIGKQFATGYVVEEDIERVVVLERGDKIRDERVTPYRGQTLLLLPNMVDLP
jgi:hypothetical protein